MNTLPIINTTFVGLLKAGTTLSGINDDDEEVTGVVEAFRFAQYTHVDKSTSYEVEYRVKWSDIGLEWISWSEVDLYNPVRPARTSYRIANYKDIQRHKIDA